MLIFVKVVRAEDSLVNDVSIVQISQNFWCNRKERQLKSNVKNCNTCYDGRHNRKDISDITALVLYMCLCIYVCAHT